MARQALPRQRSAISVVATSARCCAMQAFGRARAIGAAKSVSLKKTKSVRFKIKFEKVLKLKKNSRLISSYSHRHTSTTGGFHDYGCLLYKSLVFPHPTRVALCPSSTAASSKPSKPRTEAADPRRTPSIASIASWRPMIHPTCHYRYMQFGRRFITCRL